MSQAQSTPTGTASAEDVAQFTSIAERWWDTSSEFAPLHAINPTRVVYIRDQLCTHFERDPASAQPLTGLKLLDIGCGGGLLCEPLAEMGAIGTGIDAGLENIEAARHHAQQSGLEITYRHVLPDDFEKEAKQYDCVTNMEVIEHVADKPAFVAQVAAHLAPGGLMVLSTPNRTLASRALLVGAAEAVGAVPKGTHHWDDFVTPEELRELLSDAGLAMGDPRGIAWSPGKGLHLSADLSLNYIVTARSA